MRPEGNNHLTEKKKKLKFLISKGQSYLLTVNILKAGYKVHGLFLVKSQSLEEYLIHNKHFIIYLFICLFAFSRATPAAYGASQARSPIGAIATGLRQSHSNTGSEPRPRPTPQLMATSDP